MNTQSTGDFLPLFRSWFDTASLADTIGAAGLEGSSDNILAELDLGPMVDAETSLLNHAPSSAVEAACLLEVVRQNMADAGRSDGLDIRAITAVQQWLANASTDSTGDRSVESLLRQAQV
ncbi:hypothetical protein [Brevundimonas vesicularis]|uniref:hypothetical protein n=1 Tax=Brevundimonas vesicularis TaxID=41276 RepID=UPI0038509F4E